MRVRVLVCELLFYYQISVEIRRNTYTLIIHVEREDTH